MEERTGDPGDRIGAGKVVKKLIDFWGRVGVDAHEREGVDGVGVEGLGESDPTAWVEDVESAGEGDGQNAAASVGGAIRLLTDDSETGVIPIATCRQFWISFGHPSLGCSMRI